jgi:hypothetical protein
MSCSARMTRCPVGCLHRQFVMDYRRERQRSERAAVESSNGYAAELADYVDGASLPTFKDWLLVRNGPSKTVRCPLRRSPACRGGNFDGR